MIDPQYFGTKPGGRGLYEELKRYAPVAFIKELGRFDTSTGVQTADYLTGVDYTGKGERAAAFFTDSKYRDDILSRAPAIADELTWTYIWQAVKKETAAKHPALKEGSEEFLHEAGRRFTEVVDFTQVYDSVFSRSELERNGDLFSKMATAFMAEPITSYNMLRDGVIQAKRGNKAYFGRAVGAYMVSVVLNSALKALVQARRDDDEDKGYWEKYVGNLVGNLVDDPLSMVPYVKDIISLLNGYDVERLDMTLLSDLISAVKTVLNEDKEIYDKLQSLSGAVGALFGIPVKNVWRDAEAFLNIFLKTDAGFTARGAGYSILENLPRFFGIDIGTEADRAYLALLDGDMEYFQRLTKDKTDKEISSMMKKALKENEPRILEGAKMWADVETKKYLDILEDIKSDLTSSYQQREGLSDKDTARLAVQNDAVEAIVSLAGTLEKLKEAGYDIHSLDSAEAVAKAEKTLPESEEDEGELEEEGTLKASQIVANLEEGDFDEAQLVIDEMFAYKVRTSDKEDDDDKESSAKSSIESSITKAYKDAYLAGDSTEKRRIKNMLMKLECDGESLYKFKDFKNWEK